MINEKALMPGVEYRIKNGANISVQMVMDLIAQKAKQYDVPVSFESDQVTPDFISGLLGIKEDCCVLFHPQNKKLYLRYVIRVNRQGTYVFIRVNKTNGFALNSSFSAGAEASRSVPAQYNKDESGWYTIVDDIFEEVFA